MEEKELLEIEAREWEQAKKNIDEMVQTNKIGDISLLYKDKFDLQEKKACFPMGRVPVSILVPLYDITLVQIPAFPSREKFNEIKGFGVRDLIEWRKRGWVETSLTGFPTEYSGLGYLDELIEVSPSRAVRNYLYLMLLAGDVDRFNSILSRGTTIFKDAVVQSSIVDLAGEQTARKYGGTLTNFYTELSLLGLSKIVKTIDESAKGEMKKAEFFCFASYIFLAAPFIVSQGKTTAYDSQLKVLASIFYRIAKPKAGVFFVPCWLADVCENLGVAVPASMDIDEIEVTRKNSEDFIRAVKSLDDEIDRTVREKFEGQELERHEKESIIAKKEEFRKRWFQDVAPAFEDIRQSEQAWSVAFTTSIIASALTLSAFAGVLNIPSALAMLLASEKIKKITDPAAEYFARFWEHNPIHVGFYKVEKEVRKLKHKNR